MGSTAKGSFTTLTELFKYLDSKNLWSNYFYKINNDNVKPSRIGESDENMPKNRYCNVWPYDSTRVKLSGAEDYINASYVNTPVHLIDMRYICTQEPIVNNLEGDTTKPDFWRMVWEQGCSVIIMLNEATENNSYQHKACYPYWPTGAAVKKGLLKSEYNTYQDHQFKVKLVSKEDCGFYTVSKLQLSKWNLGEPTRNIHHLQFKGWHDYAIPSSPVQFLEFLKVARTHYERCDAPPIVHCSAGVGRTGSFVLVDTILQIINEKKSLNVDIPSILEYLRAQRMWMVQTEEQLRFCFLCIVKGAEEFDVASFGNEKITVSWDLVNNNRGEGGRGVRCGLF